MKRRDYRDYLQDILDSIKDIESFIENMDSEDFTKDKKTINRRTIGEKKVELENRWMRNYAF